MVENRKKKIRGDAQTRRQQRHFISLLTKNGGGENTYRHMDRESDK
jgi:hypothetical protein